MYRKIDEYGVKRNGFETDARIVIHSSGGGASSDNNTIHLVEGNIINLNLTFHISAMDKTEADGFVSNLVSSITKALNPPKEFSYEQSISKVSTL